MRKTLDELKRLLSERQAKLAIFKQKRPTAIAALVALFEVTVLDLFLYDTYYNRAHPNADLVPMSKRYQFENAVSGLVATCWKLVPSANEYPSITKNVVLQAIEAYHNQLMKDEVEQAIDGTRLGLNTLRKAGNTIRFEALHDSKEEQAESLIKELSWEFDSTSRELEESAPSIDRHDLVNQVARWTELHTRRAKELGLDPSLKVGKYTVEQYAEFWGALTHISWQRSRTNLGAARSRPHSIDPNLAVQVISRPDLASDIEALAALDARTIEAILKDLVYDGSQEGDALFVRPIVPLYADVVVITPTIIINNNVFRNLRQRLKLEDSRTYSAMSNTLSEEMVGNIVAILNKNGYKTREKVEVKKKKKDEGGTDIDILAKKGNSLVVLQVKNINPPDTYKQNVNAVEEILEGLGQLKKSVEFVKSHFDRIPMWFGRGETLDPAAVEIRDFLITGQRPQIGWSLVSVKESDKITDLSRFEGLLNRMATRIPKSRNVPKRQSGVMVGSIGGFRVEIEAMRITPETDQVVRLEHLWEFEDLMDLLRV